MEAANGHSVFGNHQDIAAVHLTKVKPVQRVVEYQITRVPWQQGTRAPYEGIRNNWDVQ